MFKGFQNTTNQFKGFPSLNFQMNNAAYGFSGCVFWMDAAYGTNTQTDLDSVSSWEDKIRGIKYTQQTAANQPRFKANNANYNNHPTIQFYDINRYFRTTNGIISPANYTIVLVVDAGYGQSNSENVVWGNFNTFQDSVMIGGQYFEAGIGIRVGSTFNTYTSVKDSNPHIIILSASTGIFVDGVKVKSTTLAPFQTVLETIGGGYLQNTANRLLGDLAELILFNNPLSESDSILLSNTINQKYAIY